MSFKTLPPELLGEIVSHFDTVFPSDVVDPPEIGKEISLVCRRLRSIGQQLRWRHIKIDFSSIYSLSTHLELHPQLSDLIHCFEVRDPPKRSLAPVRSEEDLCELVKVLGKLEALKQFMVVGKVNSALVKILEVAGKRDCLRQIYLVILEDVRWTPAHASKILGGFKSLVSFNLQTRRLSLSPASMEAPALPRARSLHMLELGCSKDGPVLSDFALQTFDLSSLHTCILINHAIGSMTPILLSQAPNLKELDVRVSHIETSLHLFGLLASLNRFKFLEELVVSNSPPRKLVYKSPLALSNLLKALPPNLRIANIRALWFDFDETFLAQSPPEDTPTIVWITAWHLILGKLELFWMWMDRRDGGQRWYKYPARIKTLS